MSRPILVRWTDGLGYEHEQIFFNSDEAQKAGTALSLRYGTIVSFTELTASFGPHRSAVID